MTESIHALGLTAGWYGEQDKIYVYCYETKHIANVLSGACTQETIASATTTAPKIVRLVVEASL